MATDVRVSAYEYRDALLHRDRDDVRADLL
jgi:hypothetical protein